MGYSRSLGTAPGSSVPALGDHHLPAEGGEPGEPPAAPSSLSPLEPQLLSQATRGRTASQSIAHPSQLASSTDATVQESVVLRGD